MFRLFCATVALTVASLCLYAAPGNGTDSLEEEAIAQGRIIDSIKNSEHYETGTIKLSNGKAEINVPPGFKFLNKEQSIDVLTKLWGNPPEVADKTLGMIFPENADPFTDSSFVFVVSYEEMGYVKDDDAAKINYNDLLKQIQDGEKESNESRRKEGYSTMHLIGWAQAPFYDKQNKVLHWAKDIQVGDAAQPRDERTLNYEIRILGRKGVLSIDAICTMHELPQVNANIDKVLHMASFTEGNSYFDFDPKIDKVAAWTIGTLVAGKILAKVGLLAIFGKYLLAFWKFILIGLGAIGGFFRKIFRRKKAEDNVNDYTQTTDTDAIEAPAEATDAPVEAPPAIPAAEDTASAPEDNSHL